jgi:hypothetical protein
LSTAAARNAVARRKSARARLYLWARWLHVYISTGTLLLVLFFALTGITLNHPDMMLGSTEVTQTIDGNLPAGWNQGGQVDWLKVSEYLRSENGVQGRVGDYYNDDASGQLSFRSPGYAADVFIDMQAGTYQLTIDQQGWVAVLNDLHRGRDAGGAWRWGIDLTGGFLALVAVTGLGLLLLLQKIRLRGLLTFAGGALVALVLMRVAA